MYGLIDTGESEAEYVARQKKLQDMARERMRAKFGSSSGLSGKVCSIRNPCECICNIYVHICT